VSAQSAEWSRILKSTVLLNERDLLHGECRTTKDNPSPQAHDTAIVLEEDDLDFEQFCYKQFRVPEELVNQTRPFDFGS